MQERVINVFYNEQCLPFKDKERSVHYPLIGSAFQNASNTTEIRFYADRIGGNARQWICIGKLPNGKRGFKILPTSVYDDSVGEYYLSFSLTSFFTQYKGDLYLSLGGYNGNFVELNESEEYELVGNTVTETTGAIKLNIAYSTPISGSDEEINTWEDYLEALGTKLDKNKGIVVIANTSVSVSAYDDGQLFYVEDENKLYKEESGILVEYNDFAENNIGLIVLNSATGTLTEEQLAEAKKPYCLIYMNASPYNETFIKSSEDTTYITCYSVKKSIVQNTGNCTISQNILSIRKDVSYYSLSTNSQTFYNDTQADNRFVHKTGDESIYGVKTFNTSPQTNDSDYGEGTGTKLTTKNYVLGIKNDLESEIADINKVIPSNADETHKLISSAEKGASNGVATLDSNQKVPVSQLPDSILGQVEYCGNFDASSSQDQTIRTPRKGDYYICNASGYHLPTGVDTSDWQTPIDFELGDWAIYDGSAWEKIDNTDAVQSVNGETGAVVLDGTRITLSNNDTTTITTKLGDIDNNISTINSKLPKIKDYVVATNLWQLVNGKYVAELDAGVDFVIDDNAMKIYTPTSNNDQLLRDSYGINVSSDATTQKFTFTCNIGNEAPSEVINFTIAQFGGN